MSKILVQGTKHLKPKYAYKVECDKCGSVLLLEDNEMSHTYDQRERDEWWSWKCPVCGQHHHIFNSYLLERCRLEATKWHENEERNGQPGRD